MTVSTPDIQALIDKAEAFVLEGDKGPHDCGCDIITGLATALGDVYEKLGKAIAIAQEANDDCRKWSALLGESEQKLAAALSALSGETETEWAARVTPAESDYGDAVYYEYPDRLSAERFIKNPPLWYSPRLGETKEVVSRRKAGPWIEVV